jgi:hypothetical protein
MTVYVDNARIPYGRMIMCHMVSESADELHAMADAIGVARVHFHRGHYNVCQTMRTKAVRRGAVEITEAEAAKIRRKLERGNHTPASDSSFPPRQPRAQGQDVIHNESSPLSRLSTGRNTR